MHAPDDTDQSSPCPDAIETTRSLPEVETPPGRGGEPGSRAPSNITLKREVLLSKMFPAEVARPALGRYDVLEFLGEGGMGTVYSAYDPRLERKVAIKLLRNATRDPPRRARLVREAKALAQINHANVVAIHEVWDEDQALYIAMELVEGQDLGRWQRSSRAWREILDVYLQAGEGLAAVHDAGLVYRDFKPANAIRRDEDGVVKLLDFGLARKEADASSTSAHEPTHAMHTAQTPGSAESRPSPLTRPGSIAGTPAYMAPEQFEGSPADARSDQFSFAVSLWEALYGRRPLARRPPLIHVTRAESHADPPSGLGVPAWIHRVVERGLAANPLERYPSMHELLRALRADPSARRRRALAAIAIGSVTVGGGLAVAELRTEPPTPCVAVHSVWGESQRREVEAGIIETAGPAAPPTWDRLSPRLDDYARALSQTRQQTCESHRRGLLPGEHYALQVMCLDRRRSSWSELVERLARADPAAAANANRAIMQLLSPLECADTDALMAEHPPLASEDLEAAVAEQRRQLARASTEEALGLYRQAAQRADAVLGHAERLHYAPLRAEALLRRGSARMQAEQPDAAADLDRSLWLALTTEQRRVAAEAAVKRIFVHSDPKQEDRDASEAISLARSLSQRSGAADWSIRWALWNNSGIALDVRGEPRPALDAFEHALAQIPEAGDRGRFERSTTLMNMASVQQRLGHPKRAIDSTRRAIEDITAVLGPAHPQVLQTRLSLARTHRFAGHYAQAEALLEDMLALVADPANASAPLLFEAAEVARQRGDLDRALARIQQGRSKPASELPPMWRTAFAALHASVAATRGDPTVLDQLVRDGIDIGAERRAEVLLTLGRAIEAEALLTPRVEDPESAARYPDFAQLLLGRALVAQQRFDEAEQRLGPWVEQVGDRLGILQRSRGLSALAAAEAGLGRSRPAAQRAERALRALDGFDRDCVPVREAQARRDSISARNEEYRDPPPGPRAHAQ